MPAPQMLGADQTEPAIREGIARTLRTESSNVFKLAVQELEERGPGYQRLEDFYAGGENIKPYLVPYEEEENLEYRERQQRLAVPNYAARCTDALVHAVWAGEIKRSYDGDDAATESLQEMLVKNRIEVRQREYGWSQVHLGDGWVLLTGVEDPTCRCVSINPVHPGNVFALPDPDTPNRIGVVVERRHVGRKRRPFYWLWSAEQYIYLNHSGAPVPVVVNGEEMIGWQPNPYGFIPYIRIRGRGTLSDDHGMSYVSDVVDLQEQQIQWYSDLDQLMIYQTQGVLVTRGTNKPEVVVGAKRHIHIDDPQGDASYINPNADIANVLQVIEKSTTQMADMSGVPLSVIRGGGMASSGFQLALEMQPMMRVVDTIRRDAQRAEEEMLQKLAVIAAVHGVPGFGRRDYKPSVEFTEKPFPVNEEEERQRDMDAVNQGFMRAIDWQLKWNPKIDTEEEAVAYLEAIAAEKKTQNPPPEQPQTPGFGGLIFP